MKVPRVHQGTMLAQVLGRLEVKEPHGITPSQRFKASWVRKHVHAGARRPPASASRMFMPVSLVSTLTTLPQTSSGSGRGCSPLSGHQEGAAFR